MWQQEVRNYHDETYYLFNNALNNYMNHLQKIYNRGMIEAWIDSKEVQFRSPWSMQETLEYFEDLPYPDNQTERKIWLAGYNSTKPNPKVKELPATPPIVSAELPLLEATG